METQEATRELASQIDYDKHPRIVLFDGLCNLCNSSVDFIIDHDPKGAFSFESLQSEAGRRILRDAGQDEVDFDSVVLIEDGKFYHKSTAALRIAKRLKGAWPLMYAFIAVPKFIRDAVYSYVAKNRYKWFGKRETCRFPTPELKEKFVGEYQYQ